ncbi:PD-(D/E)XK nuclease family protein [Sphingobacterium sp. lm-10]|uniref:PD-(D/E)XK nuclease family protein n=1 Tax=Sphingobacterium sp. lm-10 TaxID=2944904 RepID=UPI002020516C|nr:PD-(D/E)XK nuclease family protein [Sphingobacterium sp. lm-10]MCL7989356.1 PD-(D/E)XK nuclease family protein [Sphingobacterium sp. lm-10]
MKPFLQLVAEDIQQRFGQDLSEIAIVFNNKRPITYLKKYLSEVYGQAIWSPQFFTIQDFFKQATDKTDASALRQFFYLYELHNELLQQEGSDPESPEEFYPIAELILSDFSQLDYELVAVDQIYTELYDTGKIDLEFQHLTSEQQGYIRQFWQSFSMAGHTGVQQRFLQLWKRLPLLYNRFKERLTQEKQTNYPTLYRELAEGRTTKQHFIQPYKKIIFVGFNALNRAETTLFKRWQEEDKALFYFDTDAYYVDDTMQEAGLFIRRNIGNSGLINSLGEAPHIIGQRKDDIHLYAALGRVSQAKLLYQLLEKHEKEGQSSAILLADESLLVPLLQSLPAIRVNITTGFPLLQSPLFGLLDLWLTVQEEVSWRKKDKLPYPLIESFLSHPLIKIAAEQKNSIQKEVLDKQLFEVGLEVLKINSSVVPDFFQPVGGSIALIPNMMAILEKLQGATSGEGIALQIDYTLLYETRRVLQQLLLGMDQIGPLTIPFQIGLIRKALMPISAAIEGDPLQGVQIMGLLESRSLHFDHIYILGANEGILPKTTNSPTFLPDNLRRAYGLPVLANQDALSAYIFYRHFQYSKSIHLFYNSIVDENSSGEESRFIKQLAFESQFNIIHHTQQQPISFPAKEPELVIQKTGEVWDALYNSYLKDHSSHISATALTTYLQSPLQFFLKHIAGIKEPPSVSQEFEINNLGSIIHEVMERIFKPYQGGTDFTPTQRLEESIPHIEIMVVEEIGHQYHSPYQTAADLNSLQRIMLQIASAYIRMYLEYDIAQYTMFRIIELENSEDYFLHFPITVQGKVEHVKIYGIIDRIDEVVTPDGEVKTRIVDYKTGADKVTFKKSKNKSDEETATAVFALTDGTNDIHKALIQTFFYTYVFEEKTGLHDLEPHLYVARRMREDGTLFFSKEVGALEGDYLREQKAEFVTFLRKTLEEIFDPSIPFRHKADMHVYPSDPYTLFYRSTTPDIDLEEQQIA